MLLLNSAIGGWQEWRAEQQSQGLQQLLRLRATVLRDGESQEIDGAELVPGDVVALESGQRVAADLRLLDAQGLEIEEALLTGESLPVLKDATWIGVAEAGPADCRNMAFAGTTVARGRGHGVVVATGGSTHVGRLAVSISAPDAGKPPLVERMERFSRVIAVAVLTAAVLIGAVAVLLHGASVTSMFMFGVALAVSAIPEGLPVAITIALAIAARRMAARQAFEIADRILRTDRPVEGGDAAFVEEFMRRAGQTAVADEASARAAADSAIRSDVNAGKFVFVASSAALTHTVQHNLNTSPVLVSVYTVGDVGKFRNDIVAVEETNNNTITIGLTESRKVKVAVMSLAAI